jgi:GNAT superfamily N-acetyltransferase
MRLDSMQILERGSVEDVALAARLIGLSWSENRESSLDYTSDFLHSLYSFPNDEPPLAPAFYDRNGLVAFVMGFPRTVQLYGRVVRLLLMTFFTVAPNWKGQGLGRAIWAECLRQAKSAGYEGALHYCVDGTSSNTITAAGACLAGFEARRIFTIRHMMRLLRHEAEHGMGFGSPDPDLFLGAAASLRSNVPLKRVWNAQEVKWLCERPRSLVLTNSAGGALSGYAIDVSDAAHTPCLYVEDVLWDGISSEGRVELLRQFLADASASASMAVVPMLEYADLSPFEAVGFRRSPRVLHAYLTLWSGPVQAPEFPGMYADVL